jgi:hypothetical protein
LGSARFFDESEGFGWPSHAARAHNLMLQKLSQPGKQMRTSPVKALVNEILATIPQPYTEHIIDDVFFVIETSPEWRGVYESLCSTLGKSVVNNWSGYWVAKALDKCCEQQVASKRSSLIMSYSLLNTNARTARKKPTEDVALQLMADYYRANKAELPSDIRQLRESIIELIMAGMSAEKAFSEAGKPAP